MARHIIQVIDPKTGMGYGVAVNDTVQETIDQLEAYISVDDPQPLPVAEVRNLIEDLRTQVPEINKPVTDAALDDHINILTQTVDGLRTQVDSHRSIAEGTQAELDDANKRIEELETQLKGVEEERDVLKQFATTDTTQTEKSAVSTPPPPAPKGAAASDKPSPKEATPDGQPGNGDAQQGPTV